jgi:hypothetical protein
MPLSRLKTCCKHSLAQGMSYCLICGDPLDETTLISPDAPVPSSVVAAQPTTLTRSWLFGIIIVCLGVFAAIVIGDYYVQRKAARDAVVLAVPAPTATPTPTLTPTATPMPTPKESSSSKPEDILDGGLVPKPDPYDDDERVKAASERPRPSPRDSIDDLLYKLTPTPTLTPAQRPTPISTPRTEYLLSASDMLSAGYYGGKSQDSRRYRFRLDGIARVKGSFSARGGGVSVRILSGSNIVYSSGYEVSADSIDVALYPGTYELEVTLSSRATVSFSASLTARYNP